MFSWKRILIALVFALGSAGVTLFAVSAQEGTPPPAENKSDCASCHVDFQMSWEIGSHGHATSDPIFIEAWNKQGNPTACLSCHVTGYDPITATWKADGVTCEACHTDSSGEHPKTPMSVDKSENLCGTCHTDTRFGWMEWEGSTHYKNGMECTNCHDPHSASVKIGSSGDDASQLCITCHEEASMNFPYSKHSEQGVTCIDCHLEHLEDNDTTIHRVPDHSFKASMQTCNSCHADQMHGGGEATSTDNTVGVSAVEPTTASTPALEMSSIVPEPAPVSPLGYAGLAVLIGLAAGMLLAPWLERWYRFSMQKDEEVKHDGK